MVNFKLGEEIRKDGIINMSRAWDLLIQVCSSSSSYTIFTVGESDGCFPTFLVFILAITAFTATATAAAATAAVARLR